MSRTKKDVSKKPRFFYREPTDDAVGEYGLDRAELFQREDARKKSIRAFAAFAIFFGGTVKTVHDYHAGNSMEAFDVAADYMESFIMNGLILFYWEKFRRTDLADEKNVARIEHIEREELTEENMRLTGILQDNGLLPPHEAPTD